MRGSAVDEVPRSDVEFRTVEETGGPRLQDAAARDVTPCVGRHSPAAARGSCTTTASASSGAIVVTESDADTEARCLVLGDSYAYNMLLFLAPSFRRVTFAHTASLDFELAQEERPDVVISILNERFMIIPAERHDQPHHARGRRLEARDRDPATPFGGVARGGAET